MPSPLRAALALVLLAGAWSAAGPAAGLAEEQVGAVPAPTLAEPPAGLHGHPLWDSWHDLEPFGYEEQEFLVSGTARADDGTEAAYTTRIVVFRPDEIEIEDTWSVVGLCGTGSHHFHVHDVVVPAERTVNVFADPPSVDSILTSIPVPATLAMLLATLPLVISQSSLD